MRWATVTGVSPLRVRLDGDSVALPFEPDSLVDPTALSVSDRVRIELTGGRVVIHGRSAGMSVASFPSGIVSWTAGVVSPDGWLLCDGSEVSRTTYATLFDVIGTTYGAGNGSTTFNVPNLKGRVPVGRDSGQAEFDALAETGGAKTHTLTSAEVPATRIRSDNAASDQSWRSTGSTYPFGGSGTSYYQVMGESASDGLRVDGGGGAHNNLQPYIVLNAIIKF